MAKTYSLFISHNLDHNDVLQDLKNLIDSRCCFPAIYTQIEKNCAVDSEKAWEIKANVAKRFQESDVVLAIAGVFASHSEWMQWEMDKAKDLGLKVIGIIPKGQEQLSNEVFCRSVEDVRWDADSIVDAIRKNSK
jgi:hypothetical protein